MYPSDQSRKGLEMNGRLQASARQASVNLSEGCISAGKLQASARQASVNLSEGCIIHFGFRFR